MTHDKKLMALENLLLAYKAKNGSIIGFYSDLADEFKIEIDENSFDVFPWAFEYKVANVIDENPIDKILYFDKEAFNYDAYVSYDHSKLAHDRFLNKDFLNSLEKINAELKRFKTLLGEEFETTIEAFFILNIGQALI